MIELFEQDVRKNKYRSSKGNQLKWESNGIWYKADYTGYEGLAEYVISHLLQKSSLKSEEYVLYDLEEMKYKRQIYRGAKSQDFLEDDWQIITLERLFQTYFGTSLYKAIWRIPDHEERLRFLIGQVERITGLKEFGVYLNKLFTIDAFFLNEDRHTHNIAVLMNAKEEFRLCPMFDHGAGLLSDITLDYPFSEDTENLIEEVEAKTICTDFDEQLDLSEEATGCNLHFHFTIKDVEELLDHADFYPEEARKRVLEVIRHQMRKYQYLF